MMARITSALSAFVGGIFTFAVINDGANGWVPSHVWIAVTCVAASAFTAALD